MFLFADHQLFARRHRYHVFGCDENTLLEESDRRRLRYSSWNDFSHIDGREHPGPKVANVLVFGRIDGYSCGNLGAILLVYT